VRGAWLDNGLLHVDLVRPNVEPRVRTIPIQGGDAAADPSADQSGGKAAPQPIRPRVSDNSRG